MAPEEWTFFSIIAGTLLAIIREQLTARNKSAANKDAIAQVAKTKPTVIPCRLPGHPLRRKPMSDDNGPDPVHTENGGNRAHAGEEPLVPMIVMNQPFTDSSGNVGTKVHGPMPVSEWDEYAKKNNL